MKKYLSILTALLVAGLFTAVNVSAYDYIYSDTRPDDSFYFTDRGSADGADYTLGNYITGVKDVVAGDVIEFDVNISGIMPDYDGVKGVFWDFLYTKNLLQTNYATTYPGTSVTNPWSDWAYYNNPDQYLPSEGKYGIWIDEGYSWYDSTHANRMGEVPVMQISMTADAAFDSLLPEADGAVDLVWHWSAGTGGDVVMEDGTNYNVFENGPDAATFAHHDLPALGDCRLVINPVPVPAAIWLLGSGLLGLLGIRRRAQK